MNKNLKYNIEYNGLDGCSIFASSVTVLEEEGNLVVVKLKNGKKTILNHIKYKFVPIEPVSEFTIGEYLQVNLKSNDWSYSSQLWRIKNIMYNYTDNNFTYTLVDEKTNHTINITENRYNIFKVPEKLVKVMLCE